MTTKQLLIGGIMMNMIEEIKGIQDGNQANLTRTGVSRSGH